MRVVPNDPMRHQRRCLASGSCLACLRASAQASDFCSFHLSIWTPLQQFHEKRRLTGQCIYCGNSATFKRVHCISNDCQLLHEQNVEAVLELLRGKKYLPPHNIADRKSKMLRNGIPYHYYSEGVCQFT
jgi:hypothetical protein